MRWLTDPRLFNYLVLVLFALAALRWMAEGSVRQSLYWSGALILNLAITFFDD